MDGIEPGSPGSRNPSLGANYSIAGRVSHFPATAVTDLRQPFEDRRYNTDRRVDCSVYASIVCYPIFSDAWQLLSQTPPKCPT